MKMQDPYSHTDTWQPTSLRSQLVENSHETFVIYVCTAFAALNGLKKMVTNIESLIFSFLS